MFRAEKKVTWLLWMVVLYLGVGLDADCDSVQFGWGEKKETYDIDTQLEERWAYSLLQECIRSGLENLLAEEGVPHEIQVEEGFLPCQFSGMVRGESEEGEKIVSLLEERDPSLLSQFTEVKKGWLSWLEHRQSNSSSSFLERSKMTLQIISLDHLLSLFQKVEFLPEKKGWESSSGEGRGGKPKSEEAKLFFELPLTDEDKMLTRKIITNMADKNVLQLLMDRKSLEKKGDKVRPVHPLRFLGFILTDPSLHRSLKSISKTFFKWNAFVDGFAERMKEEQKAGTLNKYVPGFADLMGVDKHVVQHYLNRGDYEEFIKFFL